MADAQSRSFEVDVLLLHTCESCGTAKVMTPQQAFEEGWDYPPRMGEFGVLSQRTCRRCPINTTLWWRLAVEKVDPSCLSARDMALIERIKGEPESIQPPSVVTPPA